ncbi:MAG: hypothetical protein FJ317_00725, partial [SAR202 cluster bacterium]|nr:hypothetical protein [SAR202 cluster bacterium]
MQQALMALLFLWTLSMSGDRLNPSPAEAASGPHRFSLVQWEIGNFPDKWVHMLGTRSLWLRRPEENRLRVVQEYFALAEEARARSSEATALAVRGERGTAKTQSVAEELAGLVRRQERLRPAVEEVLEEAISAVVRELGLASAGGFIFPPVDIRLTEPPKLLVTSPRDRIERAGDLLLSPKVTIEQREAIEDALLDGGDVSALVTNLGGLATYPAFVVNDGSLRFALQLSAHEWLHHFLAFRPLGLNFNANPDMLTLNETFADAAGREIGDMAYGLLGGRIDPPPETTATEKEDDGPDAPDIFDFVREMRETRLETDRLLAEGKVVEAEAYMEERRLLFLEHGYLIRKIN